MKTGGGFQNSLWIYTYEIELYYLFRLLYYFSFSILHLMTSFRSFPGNFGYAPPQKSKINLNSRELMY